MKFSVSRRPLDKLVEIYSFVEGGGPLIECHDDGKIELFDVPQYGGIPRSEGVFTSLNAAMEACKDWK